MTTLRTSTRRITRINGNYRHSRNPRLVFHEGAKLSERPTRHPGSLSLAKPCSITNAFELFNGDSRLSVFCFLNEPLADDVVGVPAKASLFLSAGFQLAPNVLRPIAALLSLRGGNLKDLAAAVVMPACLLYAGAAECFARAHRRQVDYAKVHTQKISVRSWRIVGQINGYEQKPFAVLASDQIALAVLEMKPLGLVLAHHDRDDHPAFERQQRDAVNALERHQPLVIWDARVFLESGAFGFVSAIGFADLGDAADGHLSRESEIFTQLAVVELLQFDLVGRLEAEGFAGEPIGGGVERCHCGGKFFGLLFVRQESSLQGQFHGAKHNTSGATYHLIYRWRSAHDAKFRSIQTEAVMDGASFGEAR